MTKNLYFWAIIVATSFVFWDVEGETCLYHSNCKLDEICCKGKCALNCSACESHNDCTPYEYCCGLDPTDPNSTRECARSCIGKRCENVDSCGIGESCCDFNDNNVGKCFKSECIGYSCQSNSQCEPGQKCCDGTCALRCTKERCSFNSDCASDEYCCDLGKDILGKCAKSCLGKSCSETPQCSPGYFCCDLGRSRVGKCSENCLWKSCESQSHCLAGETCCGFSNKKCLSRCAGKECRSDSHCSTGECCNGHKCTAKTICDSESSEGMGDSWLVYVSTVLGFVIFGSITVAFFVCAFGCCICGRNSRSTTVIASHGAQERVAPVMSAWNDVPVAEEEQQHVEEGQHTDTQQEQRNIQDLSMYPPNQSLVPSHFNQPPPSTTNNPPPPYSGEPPSHDLPPPPYTNPPPPRYQPYPKSTYC